MLPTCEPNCGCQCNYDVLACREYRAAQAQQEAHRQIVEQAYAQVAQQHEQEPN